MRLKGKAVVSAFNIATLLRSSPLRNVCGMLFIRWSCGTFTLGSIPALVLTPVLSLVPLNILKLLTMYNILEAHIQYKDRKLCKVTVLVEISQYDIRAIFSTPDIGPGYDAIFPNEPVSDDLLQRVAGYGRQIPIDEMGKVFPRWRVNHGFNLKKR